MIAFVFGKAKVKVEVEGCVGCGTRWSWRWGYEREVAIQVGNQREAIALPKCGDCLAKGEQLRLESLVTEEIGENASVEA